MLIRSYLLKRTRNLTAVRVSHIVAATLAGIFIVAHVSLLFSLPSTLGIILGYGAVGVAMLVWLSGTAFLEKLRDSLFFHGTLASLLVALALIHAAIATANIPFDFSQLMLMASSGVLLANAVYHLRKGMGHVGGP